MANSIETFQSASAQNAQGERAGTVVLFTNAWAMGGMEQHVLDLGRSLVRHGFRVAAILYATPAIAPLRDGLSDGGVRVHELKGGSGLFGRARRFWQLFTILHQMPGSIVHMIEGWPAGDGLVILAARLAGATAIIKTEQQPPVSPVGIKQRLLTRIKDRFIRYIVCVSQDNLRQHASVIGRNADKMVVIPNAIDTAKFLVHHRPLHEALSQPSPLVGVVARLAEERKGINYFIDMAAIVARERTNIQFAIVGDGPLRPQLEEQARKLGLSDRVIFYGERRDVPQLLQTMTVFVQPSLAEGASYALLEAMAAGVPVVTTPVGSAPEIIRDGETGLIVPSRNALALAAAVTRLLDDHSLRHRISIAARELVISQYSVEAMIARYLALYRRVTSSPLSGRRARARGSR